jgi:hypothetical protein
MNAQRHSFKITTNQTSKPTLIRYQVTNFLNLVKLGYCGYIPGVKAENVFGESYGKTSTLSGKGEIQRGFDQDP